MDTMSPRNLPVNIQKLKKYFMKNYENLTNDEGEKLTSPKYSICFKELMEFFEGKQAKDLNASFMADSSKRESLEPANEQVTSQDILTHNMVQELAISFSNIH